MLSKPESILLWSSNMMGFGAGMLGPLYAVFAQNIGGDILDISWVYALYLVVMGVGMVVMGKVGDKFGYEHLSIAGYALYTCATFGYLLVHSITGLLVVQVLIGLGTAISQPPWFALYDRYSGEGDDGFVWGLSTGLWYVFQGAAMIIGGYIVSRYSFNVLFVVMGSVLLISTLYQARILKYRVQ
jgi:MFS family permease